MTAYVKFCGGCNVKYDRGKMSELIKKTFEKEIDFYLHDVSRPCDIGLLISGCDTECLKIRDLAEAKLYVKVNSPDGAEKAIREIRTFLRQN